MPKSKVHAKRRKALKGRMRFEWGDDNRPSSYAIRRVSQLPIAHGRLWNELTKAQRMGIAVVWEEIRYENVFWTQYGAPVGAVLNDEFFDYVADSTVCNLFGNAGGRVIASVVKCVFAVIPELILGGSDIVAPPDIVKDRAERAWERMVRRCAVLGVTVPSVNF